MDLTPVNLLTLPQVAERLGCCHEDVHRLAESGKLPLWRQDGKLKMFHERDLQEYLQTSERGE